MTAQLLLEQFEHLLTTPGDVEQLELVILYLALQGKLLPQDPNDEPASKLINKIRAYKKNDKKTATNVLVGTPPYDLPPNWVWTTLPEIGEVNPRNYVDDDAKEASFIPMTYIPAEYGGALKFDVRSWGEIRKGFTHLQENDVAVAKITPCFENGKAVIMKGLINGIGAGTTELHVFRGDPAYILPDYVLMFFKNFRFREDGKRKMTGSAGQQRVPNEHITQTPFPLPPIAEQKRIVARVEALFAQTRALSAKLARAESELTHLNQSALFHLLAADTPQEFEKQWDFIATHFESLFTRPEHVAPLRQSILELAVRGKLTRHAAGDESARELLKRIGKEKEERGKKEVLAPVKESEKPFMLPDGWEWAKLGSIADIGTGSTPSRSNPDYYVNGTIPWATSSATNYPFILRTDELITEDAARDTRLRIYPKHTLLVALYGQGKTRGQVSELLIDSTINQACASLVFTGEAENLREYIKLFLLKNYREMRLLAEGGAQPNLNLNKIKQMAVSIPPLAEQARIVARVEQLLGLCEALESRLRAAQSERGRLVESVLAAQN